MLSQEKQGEDPANRFNQYGWKIFLTFGAVTLAVFSLHPPILLQSLLYLGAGALAVLAMLAGLWIYRPNPMPAWILMVAGHCFNVTGDLLFVNVHYLGNWSVPDWLGPALYTLGALNFLAGLLILFVVCRRLIQMSVLIYGGIVAIGLSSMVWTLLIAPNVYLITTSDQWWNVVAFPAAVLVIGSGTSLLLMTSMGQTRSYRFLMYSILFFLMGLFFYNQLPIDVPLPAGQLNGWLPVWCNSAYSAAYFFLGSAFLHPSIKTLSTVQGRDTAITRYDMIILGLAFAAGPLVYWLQLGRGVTVDVNVTLAGMVVIFALVEMRLVQLVRVLEAHNRLMGHQQVQLKYQASHDSLTNLPNRASLDDYLIDIAGRNPTSGGLSALLMIDLDHFKQVNDSFGHGEGDIVLLKVADQLIKIKRKEDMVARWGGDEFVFIIENLNFAEDAFSFARRLFHEVSFPVGWGENRVVVTLSIGGCLFRNGIDDIQDVMKRADTALYHAKSSRNVEKISFFPEETVV